MQYRHRAHIGQRIFGVSIVKSTRVAIIGAGIAGLSAAIDLATAGFEVTVLEQTAAPGGKVRQVCIAGRAMDAGPTVFTLPEIFDDLFASAGDDFRQRVKLVPAQTLARHAWAPGGQLDLYADVSRTASAIGEFAGKDAAACYLRFTADARRTFETLHSTFMLATRPTPVQLMRRIGIRNWSDLWNIQPFITLAQATARYFRDPRLQQLFSRYATYCGSSPFAAPATLMLIAHVEQSGVWYVEGDMSQLAVQLAALAQRRGAIIRCGQSVKHIQTRGGRVTGVETVSGEVISSDALICNADNNALAAGLFGVSPRRSVHATADHARSLSAITWNMLANVEGFELAHHTVFFGVDYRKEFVEIFRESRVPSCPTIYICAQDRRDTGAVKSHPPLERLLCLINAPAIGDDHCFDSKEIAACKTRVLERLQNFGLRLSSPPGAATATSPTDFNRLFPGTGGALYGPASHGWMASFKRPGSRSRLQGLYLAGGSTHPGAGVPMAATSGRLAAAAIIEDSASIASWNRMAMRGGTSMR
jgi:1-hydroxycarotenoid 3,4-desaturase